METKYKPVYEFSGLTRIFHWIRAFAIFALIATGFYLAYPFLSANPQYDVYSLSRIWHVIIGFALIAVSIFRIYLFIFAKECQMERRSFLDFINPIIWIRFSKPIYY